MFDCLNVILFVALIDGARNGINEQQYAWYTLFRLRKEISHLPTNEPSYFLKP